MCTRLHPVRVVCHMSGLSACKLPERVHRSVSLGDKLDLRYFGQKLNFQTLSTRLYHPIRPGLIVSLGQVKLEDAEYDHRNGQTSLYTLLDLARMENTWSKVSSASECAPARTRSG